MTVFLLFALPLFSDLALVDKIDKELKEELPLHYSYSMVGGYFNTPSARMPKVGRMAFGVSSVNPYTVYGANFQPYSRLELSLNYRIYNGILEGGFGALGFGDDAERIGNVKLGVLVPEDGFRGAPTVAIGADDFIGTRRFQSKYVVATKEWLKINLETTLGWGHGRMKGFFGAAVWSPIRKDGWSLSLIAEYDPINYEKHPHEHPFGRKVSSRINGGISLNVLEHLQMSFSSIRGRALAGSGSFNYPLGSTTGLFPKVSDATVYKSPIDTEPLGVTRPKPDFVQELACAFADQGLDLYRIYLTYGEKGAKTLWLKVVNNRYRDERIVRQRMQHVLSALTPSDITAVWVTLDADGLACQAYYFRSEELRLWKKGRMGDFELAVLSPMRDAPHRPDRYDSVLFFRRSRPIWTFTVRPRLLTFFGSTTGKFKYNISAIASPEGYLFDEIYYKMQVRYSAFSSMKGLTGSDFYNPSDLPHVRTDSLLYYQRNTFALEQTYLQKGWNIGKGYFARAAIGYFEPAYGGLSVEALYYPVDSDWAFGIQAATVWKRTYHGVKFSGKIVKTQDDKPVYIPYLGVQYFFDIYYNFRPLKTYFHVSAGQFLAKDLGVKTELTRYFSSGLTFSLWYTVTNGHDQVNGHTYYDKGFAFGIPLELFLKQSSRQYVTYAMSAWLRDVGAVAETGKRLYPTLSEERFSYR